MAYLKSALSGLAATIGAAVLFYGFVMLASWVKLGVSSPVTYDARAIVQYYWFFSLPVASIAFGVGFAWQYRKRRNRAS
jgi:hypothetical protein